ncbi:MAG: DegT/DnrJ/EryC1/StrS family aminotransferase [Deltaproteobacteria bacterium]
MKGTAGVAFLDLGRDWAEVATEARRRIDGVLESQIFVGGPETAQLEAAVAGFVGSSHAVACSSGSDAIYLSLLALGLGPGDAVLVPSFTFFATAGAVVRAGARPVFVDLDPETFNSGPGRFEAAIEAEFEGPPGQRRHRRCGQRLAALLPVHLFGRLADLRGLAALARSEQVHMVEDAAQAIGAHGSSGGAGTVGDAGCLSFYPTKNLGGAGDGGMVLTGQAELAAKLRRLRTHGVGEQAYLHSEVGINARIGELQAAVLNAKLGRLAAWTRARADLASLYRQGLTALAAAGRLGLGEDADFPQHVYHQFAVRVFDGRDRVREQMAAAGVQTAVFYPLPLHLQPCMSELGYRPGDLPEAERAADEILCLPIHPGLAADDVDRVCAALASALAV